MEEEEGSVDVGETMNTCILDMPRHGCQSRTVACRANSNTHVDSVTDDVSEALLMLQTYNGCCSDLIYNYMYS